MNPLILLAKEAVENYIREGRIISVPDNLSEEFHKKRSGTFVTIEKNGNLRGCIGTYLPTRVNIAEEIIRNAIAAASEDYRFGPIKKEELPHLFYTVYILSYPEPVKDTKDLDPKKFGIIVKTGPFTFPNEVAELRSSPALHSARAKEVVFNGVVPYKTGLLLPDLEGVDTVEQQISTACQKGGIDPTQEKILIYKFKVDKYE